MAEPHAPTLLDRCRAIDLLYVRDLLADEVAILEDADHVELLADEPELQVAVGCFGVEWLAIVRTGHPVLAEFARRPTLTEVLLARDLHLERLDLTPAGRAQRIARVGVSAMSWRSAVASSSRHSRQPKGSSGPIG